MPAKNITGVDTEAIVRAAEKLVAAIAFDDSGGGLLSRETIRAADELRVILLRYHPRRSA